MQTRKTTTRVCAMLAAAALNIGVLVALDAEAVRRQRPDGAVQLTHTAPAGVPTPMAAATRSRG